MSTQPPIRDAATIIVLRGKGPQTSVLMGQRGQSAAFMPGKFVFPGGAVDDEDANVPSGSLSTTQMEGLAEDSACAPHALAIAAIRELWEETGQVLGVAGEWPADCTCWPDFADAGLFPNIAALTFFFRAVTPEGRPRRFDARFFLADANDLVGDPDDFTRAEPELAHLQWIKLSDARSFDLPFITQVVLAELIMHLQTEGPVRNVPFFRNDDEAHLVTRLGGQSPLLRRPEN